MTQIKQLQKRFTEKWIRKLTKVSLGISIGQAKKSLSDLNAELEEE